MTGEALEHKVIAHDYLGRRLLKHETVHHRNGNKADNSIGSCFLSRQCECVDERHNLELWSKSQPSGQRVADKLNWAIEILTTYGDSVLPVVT